MGGPMMGFAVSTLDIPVTKTTSSVLFLTEDEIDTRPHSQLHPLRLVSRGLPDGA